jgi:acetyl esterase/lipase
MEGKARQKEENMAENETSVRGRVIRDLIAHVTNDNLIGRKIKNGELRKKMVEPPWKCPDIFQYTLIDMEIDSYSKTCKEEEHEHFTMEYLEPKENPNLNKVVLQLHGGGYIGGMRNAYRTFAGLYSEVGKRIPVLTVDYRVAPEHPYPAALEDAAAAYFWLLNKGFRAEQIIVAGDSAGGGLAMALVMYLRDHDYEMPGGIVAMSPWTDLTASGESYDSNYERDPLFGNTRDSLIYNHDYVGKHSPKEPYISPLFGDFSDFPPMLIQVGDYEMLMSDSVSAAKKAKEAGVKVRLSIYEGMFHVFQMAMLLMPESKRAWMEVGRFLELT